MMASVPTFIPTTTRHRPSPPGPAYARTGHRRRSDRTSQHLPIPHAPWYHNYDIFEGTEQIQQLVIARAISGLRIE